MTDRQSVVQKKILSAMLKSEKIITIFFCKEQTKDEMSTFAPQLTEVKLTQFHSPAQTNEQILLVFIWKKVNCFKYWHNEIGQFFELKQDEVLRSFIACATP